MQKLIIHPDTKEFTKYLLLARKFNWGIELRFALFKDRYSEIAKTKLSDIFIHGGKGKQIFAELSYLRDKHISGIIYHDDELKTLLLPENLQILKRYTIPVYLENAVGTSLENFQKNYQILHKSVSASAKCLDTGHVNLLDKNRVSDWMDGEVAMVHLNNNNGRDDEHSSLWKGTIKSETFANILKDIRYISLEIDKDYKEYQENITYLKKHNWMKFPFIHPLNLPVNRSEFAAILAQKIKTFFNKNIVYAFLYGSYVHNQCRWGSDLDMLIVVRENISQESRSKLVKILEQYYRKYYLIPDSEYPVEIFSEKEIAKLLQNKFMINDDSIELLSAYFDKIKFLCGNKNAYKLDRNNLRSKFDFRNLLNNTKENRKEFAEYQLQMTRNARHKVIASNSRLLASMGVKPINLFSDISHLPRLSQNDIIKKNISVLTEENSQGDYLYIAGEKLTQLALFLSAKNVTEILKNCSPVLSTNNFLNPAKLFKTFKYKNNLYISIELKNPDKYLKNKKIIDKALKNIPQLACTVNDFLIISENGRNFLIENYLGISLEDQIKNGDAYAENYLGKLKIIHNEFKNNQVLFRGFVPRNIIPQKDKLILIDYEKVFFYDKLQPEELEQHMFFEMLGFNDVFSQDQIRKIFSGKYFQTNAHLNSYVTSDDVEKKYFGSSFITVEQRRKLNSLTNLLERRHRTGKENIYGHKIGQFLSENEYLDQEVTLLKFADQNKYSLIKVVFIFFDILLDFEKENLLRADLNLPVYALDISSLIMIFVDKLGKDTTMCIALLNYFLAQGLNKRILYKDKYYLLKLMKEALKSVSNIYQKDLSRIYAFNFADNKRKIMKIVHRLWKDEIPKTEWIARNLPDITFKLDYSCEVNGEFAFIRDDIYLDPKNIKKPQLDDYVNILVALHKMPIKQHKINSELLDINSGNIVENMLLKLGFPEKMIAELLEKVEKCFAVLNSGPVAFVHNDLLYDQFLFNGKLYLIDWTFLEVGSPFVDIICLIRNDYDHRNDNFREKLTFLKSYLEKMNFTFLNIYEYLEAAFYINCFRDLVWFNQRLIANKLVDGEIYSWITDAVKDISQNRFRKFLSKEILKFVQTFNRNEYLDEAEEEFLNLS